MTYCFNCGKEVDLELKVGEYIPPNIKNSKKHKIVCDNCREIISQKMALKKYKQKTTLEVAYIKPIKTTQRLYQFQEKRGIRKLNEHEQLNEINLVTSNFNSDLYQEDLYFMKLYGINISKLIRLLVHEFLQKEKTIIGVK